MGRKRLYYGSGKLRSLVSKQSSQQVTANTSATARSTGFIYLTHFCLLYSPLQVIFSLYTCIRDEERLERGRTVLESFVLSQNG